jgi:uncharacterized protein (TIRG00374 family)
MDAAHGSHPDDAATPRPQRSRLRRTVNIVISVAVSVGLLVGVLPAIADFSEVWALIRSLTWLQVVVLLAFAGWNLMTYQFVTMAAIPGLSLGKAFMVGQISTAVSNTIPAGSALGIGVTYAMFTAYGYSAMEIGLAVALTGLWNLFVKLGLPIVALAIVALGGDRNPALLTAALAGVVALVGAVGVLVLVVRSRALAGRIGDVLGAMATRLTRPFRMGPFDDWGPRFQRFRARTAELLEHRWHWLTATSLLSHLSLFGLLLASLRILGVDAADVSWAEALAAFALVRLVTALPITPGGLGVVELGMTAALVLAGGAETEVVAAVLVYRALTYALQIPVGLGCWVAWKLVSRATATAPS